MIATRRATKPLFMRSMFYVIALLIVMYWALGAFVWELGTIVHCLLLPAAGAVLLGIFTNEHDNMFE
jgi:fatty acid desaturase